MKGGVRVEGEWMLDGAMRALGNVSRGGIKKMALFAEAQAKANIAEPFEHADGEVRGQIDTTAMINSTRAVTSVNTLPAGAVAALESPQEYAPYQEAIRPFFFPAIEQAVADADKFFASEARREGLT